MIKNVFRILSVLFIVISNVTAQDVLKNKNDMVILPDAGEFAIGFSAVPIFNWVGNTFNGNQNNIFIGDNKFVNSLGQNVLFGKYMYEKNTAIRIHIRAALNNDIRYNYVFDDTQNSPDSLVLDRGVFNNQLYTIGVGYELRKGKGRVQGIYGSDIFFMHTRGSATYEYGNTHGMLNQAPTTTTTFFMNGGGLSSPQGVRLTNEKDGSLYAVGVRPFAGIEYFFAPKISIGSEFGWSLMFSTRTDGHIVEEFFAADQGENGKVIEKKHPIAGAKSWLLDTDNFNGVIFLMFYF